jgi:hypothetical protein
MDPPRPAAAPVAGGPSALVAVTARMSNEEKARVRQRVLHTVAGHLPPAASLAVMAARQMSDEEKARIRELVLQDVVVAQRPRSGPAPPPVASALVAAARQMSDEERASLRQRVLRCASDKSERPEVASQGAKHAY